MSISRASPSLNIRTFTSPASGCPSSEAGSSISCAAGDHTATGSVSAATACSAAPNARARSRGGPPAPTISATSSVVAARPDRLVRVAERPRLREVEVGGVGPVLLGVGRHDQREDRLAPVLELAREVLVREHHAGLVGQRDRAGQALAHARGDAPRVELRRALVEQLDRQRHPLPATETAVARRFSYAFIDEHGSVEPAGPAPYLDCVAAPLTHEVIAARALPWLAEACTWRRARRLTR